MSNSNIVKEIVQICDDNNRFSAEFKHCLLYTMGKEGWDNQTDYWWDTGGRTRFGIAEKHWPDFWKNGPPGVEIVPEFYYVNFWEPMHLHRIESIAVCQEAFDSGVLCGTYNGTRFLQSSYNKVCRDRPLLVVDGIIGPVTAGSVNIFTRNRTYARAMFAAQQGLQFSYFDMIGNRQAMTGWCAQRLGAGESVPEKPMDGLEHYLWA